MGEKIDKVKRWAKDHKHDLILGATVGTILGVVAGLIVNRNSKSNMPAVIHPANELDIYQGFKPYKLDSDRKQKKLYDFLVQEEDRNMAVYPLDDGRFLSVDENAKQDTVNLFL